MSSPSPFPSSSLNPAQTSSCDEAILPRPRIRKRATSLMSVSSTQSRITLDLVKAEPTAIASMHPLARDAYGSFVPTSSASNFLQRLAKSMTHSTQRPYGPSFPPSRKQPIYLWIEDDDSPLSSGLPSPAIPSLSRTASSSSLISSFPPTLVSSSTIPRSKLSHGRSTSSELNPILAKLERKSKLLTQRVYCATCKKPGSDFPKCGRCNDMWCSRECRMYGGKRHVCTRTK